MQHCFKYNIRPCTINHGKKRLIVFIIIVGDRPYLHEGKKLSNLKDIQTI
jgi:hypothetical protein